MAADGKFDVTLCNYGTILRALNRHAEALEQFSAALAVKASVAETWNDRGAVYLDLNRPREAIADFDRAIAINSKFPDAFFNKGRALIQFRSFEAALAAFDQALAIQPNLARAWLGRGNALYGLSRRDDAWAAYDRALALDPGLAGAWTGRAAILIDNNRYEEAWAATERALALQSDFDLAWSCRGNVLVELNRYVEAIAAYDRAIALRPDCAEAWCGRGSALVLLGRYEEGIIASKQALNHNSHLAIAYNNIGVAHAELGQLEEAKGAFLAAIEVDPNFGSIYLNLVQSKEVKLGDPELAAMEAILAKGTLAKAERMKLDFALGKAYADTRDYRRSFQHLLAGNAAKRSIIQYDEAAQFAVFDRIEQTFSRELIAAKTGSGITSSRPIFVLGMPRSGSSLVEQVLASHPDVEGAGELMAFKDAVRSVREPDGMTIPYPDFVPAMHGGMIKAMAEQYLAQLASLAPHGHRVTDKMPDNFLFAGLIHLVLPNAVIIHTVRDPVDTCISCFATLFREKIDYAFDLGELGRYYTRYSRLMDYWRRVLPPNRILDVRYEDVIADLEGQVRRILSHCSLTFDDRCVAFYKSKRAVRTASQYQVRQPIYRSAVGKWRSYAELLMPLLVELGIEAPAEI